MGKTIQERAPQIRTLVDAIMRRQADGYEVFKQVNNLIGLVANSEGVSYNGLDHDVPPELSALIDPILLANGRSTLADVARWFRNSSGLARDCEFQGAMSFFVLPGIRQRGR